MTENCDFSKAKYKKVRLRTQEYVYARLLLTYSLIYTLSFLVGCIIFHCLKISPQDGYNASILSFFSVNFSQCNSITEYALLLMTVSSVDIKHLTVIFSAGFTMLSGAIVSAVIIFRGFSLGFSLSYLIFVLKERHIYIDNPWILLTVYSVICAIAAAILLDFSARTLLFCDGFKSHCQNIRKFFRFRALYSHIFRFLIALGVLLILNFIRCLL